VEKADFSKYSFGVPPFNAKTDLPKMIIEVINGAFGTFPYESNAYFCKTNTTSIPGTADTIFVTFTDSWTAMKKGVRAV
jgi:hypothetical protein